jgi:translation initiation factor 2B subunit (eIF-2B alpha/beta/delta family)
MKKLSDEDDAALADLVERNGVDRVALYLKHLKGSNAGRPSDFFLNDAIIWAHIEFLKLHRVVAKKKKLESACELLAEYLDRFTHDARPKSSATLENIYKRAKKHADKVRWMAAVMSDVYRVLERHLEHKPQKVPVPYLIEGKGAGQKYPTLDTYELHEGCEVIGSKSADYAAAFSMIVTPKNI